VLKSLLDDRRFSFDVERAVYRLPHGTAPADEKRQGPGDEGRGALCSGSFCGSDWGAEPAGSGAALWDRPADGCEDAGVFGAARVPAEPAAGASEARPVHGGHRPDPG
jgi:hypothetical protein